MPVVRCVRVIRSAVLRRLYSCAMALSGVVLALSVNSPDLSAAEPAQRSGEHPTKSAGPPIKVETLARGSSSRSTLRDAMERLPLDKLTNEQRRRVNEVLEHRSMFRRLPAISIDADPEVYNHLTHNPESVVGIWRVLGISKFTMQQTGPTEW